MQLSCPGSGRSAESSLIHVWLQSVPSGRAQAAATQTAQLRHSGRCQVHPDVLQLLDSGLAETGSQLSFGDELKPAYGLQAAATQAPSNGIAQSEYQLSTLTTWLLRESSCTGSIRLPAVCEPALRADRFGMQLLPSA